MMKKGKKTLPQKPEMLPNDWRKWVATNLMKGAPVEHLSEVLANHGFSDAQIINEMNLATSSPYLEAGKDITTLLRRRDWLLSTKDILARLDSSYNQNIDVIDTPSFDVFIKNYYSKHLPVILKNGINHWEALKKWTPQYFAENFGDKDVQIQYDRETEANFEIKSHELRKTFKMSEFVDMMNTHESSNNFYITANNTAQNVEIIRDAFQDLGDFGEGYRELSDDPAKGTFFWMGPAGTFTPIHFDLTNNMLIQIYGSKKVTLFPANQVPLLYNYTHVFSEVDYPNVDYQRYPLMRNVTPIEVIIEPGDALFIPIGWWHCVDALDQSISISFINFNAPNSFGNAYKAIG